MNLFTKNASVETLSHSPQRTVFRQIRCNSVVARAARTARAHNQRVEPEPVWQTVLGCVLTALVFFLAMHL